MSVQENIKAIQSLQEAVQQRDERRLRELYAEDVVVRAAGVPRTLGGVTQGREQVISNLRQNPPEGEAQLRAIFGDESHVCAIMKVSGPFSGNQNFRGSGKPFSTYGCIVYGLEGGRIREQTMYLNFLDVYVQAGLVPLDSLVAKSP